MTEQTMRQMNDNAFMRETFNRFSDVKSAFEKYAALPASRVQAAAFGLPSRADRIDEDAAATPRQIWLDTGFSAYESETLADHQASMLKLQKLFPSANYDEQEAVRQIKVWAPTRVVAGEKTIEQMDYAGNGRSGYANRQRLRELMAEFVHAGSPAKIDRAKVLNAPVDAFGNSFDDESALNSDRDFIVTALWAHAQKSAHPAKLARLDKQIEACHAVLMTDAGRDIWVKAFSVDPNRILVKTNRDAAANEPLARPKLVPAPQQAPAYAA